MIVKITINFPVVLQTIHNNLDFNPYFLLPLQVHMNKNYYYFIDLILNIIM